MIHTRTPILRRSSAPAKRLTNLRESSTTSKSTVNSQSAHSNNSEDQELSTAVDEATISMKGTKRRATFPEDGPLTKKVNMAEEPKSKSKSEPKSEPKSSEPKSEPESDEEWDLLIAPKPASKVSVQQIVPKPAAEAVPSVAVPKKIIRGKKTKSNPFRTDIRMGTSGTTAAGEGTLARKIKKPTLAAPLKPPKRKPAAPKKTVPTEDETNKKATEKLKAATTTVAASKEHSTVLNDLGMLPGMREKLIQIDKSVAKSRGSTKARAGGSKASWREDNDEIDELVRDTSDTRKIPPSKKTAVSAGTKKLLKSVGAKSGTKGSYPNAATVSTLSQRDIEARRAEKAKKDAKRDAKRNAMK